MYLSTQCVVLARRNFGEADRLLTIYTKDFGKLTAIAKGIRRPTSRKSGHLEPGSWCKIFIAKGKNIDILTEVEVQKAYGIENFSQGKAVKIFHLLELVDHLTVQNQKNTQVYSLLVNFLRLVENNEDFNLVSSVFKIKLLKILGFFSATNLKNSRTRDLLNLLEMEDFNKISLETNLSVQSYLKLLTFLDSMIESVTQRKLKTTRFLNGQL